MLIALVLLDLGVGARFTIVGAETHYGPSEDVLDRVRTDHHKLFVLAGGRIRAPIAHRPGSTYFDDMMRSEISRGYWLYKEIRPIKDNDSDGQSNRLSVIGSSALARFPGALGPRLFARSGVAWVSTPVDQGRSDGLGFDVPGEAPHYLLPVPDVVPYVRAYARWEAVDLGTIRDRTALIDVLTGSRYWNVALVPPGSIPEATGSRENPTEWERCEQAQTTRLLPESGPGTVVVLQESGCDVLLVALETHMPRWRVWVDDEEVPLLQAELGSIAVHVPRGRHVVRFEYVSRSRFWGWVSVSALAVVFGLFFVGREPREPQAAA